MSKIQLDPAAIKMWNEFKEQRLHQFITFKIQNKSVVTADFSLGRGATYNEFIDKIVQSEPRYAVFDYEWKTGDGVATPITRHEARVYLFWHPEQAPTRLKMEYAQAHDSVRKALNIEGLQMTVMDASELDEEILLSKLSGR